jgi:hypothetical protein
LFDTLSNIEISELIAIYYLSIIWPKVKFTEIELDIEDIPFGSVMVASALTPSRLSSVNVVANCIEPL